MKNKAISFLILAFLCLTAYMNAQNTCPLNIDNNLSCAITVSVTLHDDAPGGCPICAGSNASFTVTVPANSQLQISCNQINTDCTSPNICNIVASIISPFASASADFNTGPISITPSLGCGGTAGSSINVSISSITVSP